jgi:hypothetical protein
MTIDLKKIKEILRWKNIRRSVSSFLKKKSGWIIYILVFLLSGYSAYLWYGYVYNPRWSEERKKQYIEEAGGKEVVFKKNQFEKAIKNYTSRGEKYNAKVEDLEDIFKLNK